MDIIAHHIADFILFFSWFFSNLTASLSKAFLPFYWLFHFFKAFFNQVFSEPVLPTDSIGTAGFDLVFSIPGISLLFTGILAVLMFKYAFVLIKMFSSQGSGKN